MRRVRLSAEDRAIAFPVAVEPVNMSLSIPGCSAIRAPMSRPPGTTRQTSAGSASFSTQTRACTDNGVYSLGFTTTVSPTVSAGATCQMVIIIGQFQGPMAPTTPAGR